MDGALTIGTAGTAPFLLKTYDMVDESSTDHIVSWSSNNSSFIVWNPPEFSRVLLPLYFKHNNFSSFIRQLNTYGFRKIDSEKWEFSNEEFSKDKKHLLKNIHRRKPIHSHSNPQGNSSVPDRAAYESEIAKLLQEKSEMQAKILKYEKEQPAEKLQLEEMSLRVNNIKSRQDRLLAFMDRVSQNPDLKAIVEMKLKSMSFSGYNKRRCFPSQVSSSQPDPESSSTDTLVSSRPEFVSDTVLVSSHSTQFSNEDDDNSRQTKQSDSCDPKDMEPARSSGVLFSHEPLELSDTGTSFTFNIDPVPYHKARSEEADSSVSCHLNLSLASSETRGKEADLNFAEKNKMSLDDSAKKQVVGGANDLFWEQFLTEKPGSMETEEAITPQQ